MSGTDASCILFRVVSNPLALPLNKRIDLACRSHSSTFGRNVFFPFTKLKQMEASAFVTLMTKPSAAGYFLKNNFFF